MSCSAGHDNPSRPCSKKPGTHLRPKISKEMMQSNESAVLPRVRHRIRRIRPLPESRVRQRHPSRRHPKTEDPPRAPAMSQQFPLKTIRHNIRAKCRSGITVRAIGSSGPRFRDQHTAGRLCPSGRGCKHFHDLIREASLFTLAHLPNRIQQNAYVAVHRHKKHPQTQRIQYLC